MEQLVVKYTLSTIDKSSFLAIDGDFQYYLTETLDNAFLVDNMNTLGMLLKGDTFMCDHMKALRLIKIIPVEIIYKV